jgi:hypothetical protein
MRNAFIILSFFLIASFCYAHMSPPVQLVGEEEAVRTLMPDLKIVAQHLRLSSPRIKEIYRNTGWRPSEKTIRYYTGTDEQGAVHTTVFVISDYTLHGSIRVAAACNSEGKVTGAELLELSEEAYNWVKPLIDQNYMKQVVQENAAAPANAGTMTKYYAEQIAKAVRQVPVLCNMVKQ